MQNVIVLGSTGSIGRQSLDVIRGCPERWRVLGMSAGRNVELFMRQIKEFRPKVAATSVIGALQPYKDELQKMNVEILEGPEAICQIASIGDADLVLSAISGIAGVIPTYEALKAGITVALANKESLVTAGSLLNQLIKQTGAKLLPVDSEHSAIIQCIEGKKQAPFRIWLTASGGPFLGYRRDQLEHITPKEALNHPVWNMWDHITIDSATMLNKGLEVIEAHWLFNLPYEKIETVVHPESIVHSLVEFEDGAFLAQMSKPDMRLAIQYALNNLRHRTPCYEQQRLLPHEWGNLHFQAPDYEVFEGLELSIQAGRTGGTMPTVLNAAKEVVVESFLLNRIRFLDMTRIIRQVLEQHTPVEIKQLGDVLEADQWARLRTAQAVKEAD